MRIDVDIRIYGHMSGSYHSYSFRNGSTLKPSSTWQHFSQTGRLAVNYWLLLHFNRLFGGIYWYWWRVSMHFSWSYLITLLRPRTNTCASFVSHLFRGKIRINGGWNWWWDKERESEIESGENFLKESNQMGKRKRKFSLWGSEQWKGPALEGQMREKGKEESHIPFPKWR